MLDTIIIGAGPAGLSAGVYAARYLMDHVIIGQLTGGLITTSHKVENYPGFRSITGWDLGLKFVEHAEGLGSQIHMEEVSRLETLETGGFRVSTNGGQYEGKTVILAYGLQRRKLQIPGEERLAGKGISYCATCDGAFYRDKVVGVVGGSNTACEAALYLADLAEHVYLIYRREALRAEPADVKLVEANSKISIVYSTNLVEALGASQLEQIRIDKPYNGSELLALDGLFIEVGSYPNHDIIADLNIDLDDDKLIRVDSGQRTNVPGVYAAGDITTGSDKFQQVVTAVSEGAIAAMNVHADMKKGRVYWCS
ncbi:MAG TPA: FAD-dependent oxidoreductase [bacterium]|nr:FAD-dependent oxidoreductase [bacterium]